MKSFISFNILFYDIQLKFHSEEKHNVPLTHNINDK